MVRLGFCLRGFNVLTQYVARIETFIRRFCIVGIMSGGDFALAATSHIDV